MHFRSWDAHSFAPHLNDGFGKRGNYTVDRRRTDHSFPANDGSLGGLTLLGAREDRNDRSTAESRRILFSMRNREEPHHAQALSSSYEAPVERW